MHTLIHISGGNLQLFNTYILPLHFPILIVLLLIATAIDVRERRIPNRLVAVGMVIGAMFHSLAPQGDGVLFALKGLGTGMALMLPLYIVRAMGAGDVKLMGMIGTFLGIDGVIGAVLATMAAGGVLALGVAACKGMLPQLFTNLYTILVLRHIRLMGGSLAGTMPATPSVGKMPYAVAISAGTLIQLFVLRY